MTNSVESDSDRTLWCGNLGDKITEELLYELFLQAGPLENVKVPTDKEGRRRNFGFILFKHGCSVPYAIKLFNGVRLHGRSLNLQFRPGSVHSTPPRTGGGSQSDTFPPSPMMDVRGLPLFNGAPNFMTRMGPPLPMQPLMSPNDRNMMGLGIHRSWSAPAMPRFPDDQANVQGPQGGGLQRDRSRDGRDGSRERDRSYDRDRGRDDRNDRGRQRDRDGGHRDGGRRDRDHRGRDRDYRNTSQDRDFRDRSRNSSQDRNNDLDASLSRLRRGETYPGPNSQSSTTPSLMSTVTIPDPDQRRSNQGSHSRGSSSQRVVPPWQRPY